MLSILILGHIMPGLYDSIHTIPHSQNTEPLLRSKYRAKYILNTGLNAVPEYRLGNRATYRSCYNFRLILRIAF